MPVFDLKFNHTLTGGGDHKNSPLMPWRIIVIALIASFLAIPTLDILLRFQFGLEFRRTLNILIYTTLFVLSLTGFLTYLYMHSLKKIRAQYYDDVQRYNIVLNNIPDVVFQCDTNGKFLMLSSSAKSQFGYPENELLQLSFSGLLFEPNGWKEFKKQMMVGGGKLEHYEVPMVDRKEHMFWMEITAEATHPTRTETVIQGVMRNVDRHLKMERLLLERENLFRLLADNSSQGVLIYNHEMRFIYGNKRASELLKIPPEKMYTTLIWDVVHPDEKEKLVGNVDRRISGESGAINYPALRCIDGSGGEVHFKVSTHRADYDGSFAVMITFDYS